MIEVIIDSIRVSLISQQRIVMLRDIDGDHQLPIWIGPCEAESISIELQETEYARPLTHDLMYNIVEDMGGKVSHILISELRDSVFIAQMYVKLNGSTKEIDCRPSDAIALAVRAKVPIFVNDDVMAEVGITPEPDISDVEDEETYDDLEDEVMDAELDAFRDFLENLDDD